MERAGTVLAILGLLVVGFLTSLDVWTVVIAPLFLRIQFLQGALSVGTFSVVVAVTGGLLGYDVWRDDETERVREGPLVQAIVPAYRDADVLDASVTSLLVNDYDPLRVVIVVEPDDERTHDRAAELAATYDPVEVLVNDDPGSKATAINNAVAWSPADHFVIFDADERAEPTFVSTAMGELLGETDVFQGRRVPRPTGPVETLAYSERVVVQAGYRVGDFVGFTQCQSSATGVTREALAAVGGYADVLTEDLYFSHQCYKADLTVTQNRRCTSSMEAPHTLADLWGQRKRWRIGHVQVSHLRIREALRGRPGGGDLITVGRAVGSVLAGGALLVLAAHVLFLLVLDASAVVVPVAAIIATIGGVWLRDLLDGRVGPPSWTIALAPLVYLGHGVLTVKCALEYLLTWEGEWYQVTKTGT
ncbi:glycosyltransferase family 2 protein [Halopenitus sp. POP-27]|uniref:glycosyltransferase n=1 Tax=Halopenitus sp. POP-27 TaxID=2994425 RepID=UPI002468FDB3|nr:glycosyltransferase family 2 protein [Halopenitus sp. POP-27]